MKNNNLPKVLFTLVAFLVLMPSVQAKNTYDTKIEELKTSLELVTLVQLDYEDDEKKYSEPIWVNNSDGIPVVIDGKQKRERIRSMILIASSIGVDELAKKKLSLMKQIFLSGFSENDQDSFAEEKIMAKIKARSESIRRNMFADIEEIQNGLVTELARLKEKSAALNESLNTDNSGTSELGNKPNLSCNWKSSNGDIINWQQNWYRSNKNHISGVLSLKGGNYVYTGKWRRNDTQKGHGTLVFTFNSATSFTGTWVNSTNETGIWNGSGNCSK